MEPIYIPQLAKFPDQTQRFTFREYVPKLETLMPVKGDFWVKHQNNYLEVFAQAETIVTLTCCRCLNNYNHRLDVKATELIWLQEPSLSDATPLLEQEVALEDLVETLPPTGYFHPSDWLYEQLCLNIPQRQLCDSSCVGIPIEETPETSSTAVDHRWAALAALKQQLSE
ncbi:MAG: YceD family protein [Cyanobacteria bacterium P01_A01_bin.123]